MTGQEPHWGNEQRAWSLLLLVFVVLAGLFLFLVAYGQDTRPNFLPFGVGQNTGESRADYPPTESQYYQNILVIVLALSIPLFFVLLGILLWNISLIKIVATRTKSLAESEALLNEMSRIAKTGGWEFNAETLELVWTDEVYRILEVDRHVKPTMSSGIGFYAPASRPVIEQAMHRAVTQGLPFDRELEIITAQGNSRWVHTVGKVLQEHGKTKKIAGTFQDITDRKRGEEALRESEEFNRGLVENMPDMVVVCDRDRKIRYMNPAVTITLGYPPDELVGTDLLDYVVPELRAWIGKIIHERLTSGVQESIEADLVRKDGLHLAVIIKGTSLLYHNEPAVLLLVTSINERKELEKEMEYHEEELIRFSKSLDTANKKLSLLSGITRHDINNQLTVLQGYVGLLHSKIPDPLLSDYFTRITDAGTRISAMIRFTREYENIGINAPVWQDCRTLVDTAAKDYAPGHIHVVNDLPPGGEMFADPLIFKVCYNLMDNAERYCGKCTTIRFSVQESGDDHLIVCEDNGEGVPAEEKERIFERGFGKNTGLGLALSREILSITGITIKETGEPAKGARFEMRVPAGSYRMRPHTGEGLRSES